MVDKNQTEKMIPFDSFGIINTEENYQLTSTKLHI
jgi:hypothetical protein